MRTVGTVVRGIRAPIFRKEDDLAKLTCECVLQAAQSEGFAIKDRDVIGVTESTLARTQGNYATVEQIAADVRSKFPGGVAGIVHPILSRNRFSLLLKGISMGLDKLYIQLAYPSDEVGNHLISWDELDEKGVNPTSDVLTEQKYRELFGEEILHPFTGVDYVRMYKEIAPNCEIFLANDPRAMLKFTPNVLCCDIHTRERSKRLLQKAGAERVYTMADILSQPVEGSGYNPNYGLYGSNLSDEHTVKLFPRDCQDFVNRVQQMMLEKTGKRVEVMVYGDGAFKDPVGKIWELADPVVSPGYTSGLEGTPNELKLKHLADTSLKGMEEGAAEDALRKAIEAKSGSLVGSMAAQGTTPRRYTDLLGSLCDLTSGSGDKGTPIVLVQDYFTNFADE
ncbi:MAG TPA: coenzyme F420-0:L-glutamate ligase [Candidatus Faecaligallichristensenella faecipullorum]|nr:coenzyme F420-0:L-glutamate ligase [Candidatus Faecaligallichristensenella faecipullorum]